MNKEEIKAQNKKAMPKFIVVLIVCFLLGIFLGVVSSLVPVDSLSWVTILEDALYYFTRYISVILLVGGSVVFYLTTIPKYKEAKVLLEAWNFEEESIGERIELLISKTIWKSISYMIFSFFLFCSLSYGALSLNSSMEFIALCVGLLTFVFSLYIVVRLQQKCVDLIKRMNPEKDGSVYDLKFEQKWYASCDEAERFKIGQASYKAYMATNITCVILLVALVFLAPIFHLGIAGYLIVCILWFVNSFVYYRESLK